MASKLATEPAWYEAHTSEGPWTWQLSITADLPFGIGFSWLLVKTHLDVEGGGRWLLLTHFISGLTWTVSV